MQKQPIFTAEKPLVEHIETNNYHFYQYRVEEFSPNVAILIQVVKYQIKLKRKSLEGNSLFFQNCLFNKKAYGDKMRYRNEINKGNWHVIEGLGNDKIFVLFDLLLVWLEECVSLIISEESFNELHQRIIKEENSNQMFDVSQENCLSLCGLVYAFGTRVFNTNCVNIFNSIANDIYSAMIGGKSQFRGNCVNETRSEQVSKMIEIAYNVLSNPSTIVDHIPKVIKEPAFFTNTGGASLVKGEIDSEVDLPLAKNQIIDKFLKKIENPASVKQKEIKRAFSLLQPNRKIEGSAEPKKPTKVRHSWFKSANDKNPIAQIDNSIVQSKFGSSVNSISAVDAKFKANENLKVWERIDSWKQSNLSIDKNQVAEKKEISIPIETGKLGLSPRSCKMFTFIKKESKEEKEKSFYLRNPLKLRTKNEVDLELVGQEDSSCDSQIERQISLGETRPPNKIGKAELKQILYPVGNQSERKRRSRRSSPRKSPKKRRGSSVTVSITINEMKNYFNA